MFVLLFWGMSRITIFENDGAKINALGCLCTLLSGDAVHSEPMGHRCDYSEQVLGHWIIWTTWWMNFSVWQWWNHQFDSKKNFPSFPRHRSAQWPSPSLIFFEITPGLHIGVSLFQAAQDIDGWLEAFYTHVGTEIGSWMGKAGVWRVELGILRWCASSKWNPGFKRPHNGIEAF
jgi:hypothetical protein